MTQKGHCKNCQKEIPTTLKFCSETCKQEYKNRKYKPRPRKLYNSDSFITELNYLGDDAEGREIEVELARGRNIKGKIIGFDNRFGKILIEHYENKRKVVTIVKLSYIVSFHIYGEVQK